MELNYNNRIQLIYQLLFEMSKGNFNYRIPRSNSKDKSEALIALLNSTVEEIQESFVHQGFITMHNKYSTILQAVFLINTKGEITFSNPEALKLLMIEEKELLQLPFQAILDKASKTKWKEIFNSSISNNNPFEKHMQLTFSSKSTLLLPTNCSIIKLSKFENDEAYLLVSFLNVISNRKQLELNLTRKVNKQLKRNKEKSINIKYTPSLKFEDLNKIRAIRELISNNPEKPIESLSALASHFNTNDFKIKQGFRELYGMTVFQYQMQEKLNKAHILVKSTDLSFKEIMGITGFVSQAHFSKVFKKRYGYSPRNLRKLL